MEEGWLQVWCYLYRGAIISDMSADPVHLADMPACTVQLHKTCMFGTFIQICVFVKCKASGLLQFIIHAYRSSLQWYSVLSTIAQVFEKNEYENFSILNFDASFITDL